MLIRQICTKGSICIVLILSVFGCTGGVKARDTEILPLNQQQTEFLLNVNTPQHTETVHTETVLEAITPPPPISNFTGDGKKGMSLGIQVPEGQGLNTALSNIPSMVQGCLVYNIRKYSAITVLDPVALDKVIMETLDGKYEDNLDIVRLGHIAHVEHWMTGRITETPYGYNLQFNVTDTTPNARTLASYSGNCTASQLIDQSAIQIASIELLTQMGVQLTTQAKNELSTTNTQQSIKAQSFLANSRASERQGGNEIEVYFNAVLAAKFDPTLPEAVNRSAILAANISSARTGDNLREDVRWRNEWVARLAETEKYVKDYNDYYNKYYSDYYNDFYKKYTDNWNKFIQSLPELPNTLFYTADARNYGATNYDNNTTSYTGIKAYLHASQNWIQSVQTAIQTMDAPVAEVQRTVQAEQAAVQAAIQEVVRTVNNGLNATGQMSRWRLQPLNVGVTAVRFNNSFVQNRRQKQENQTFNVTVELVNSQNNRVIGRSAFQTSRTFSITNSGLSVSDDEQKIVNFTNVNIHELPPSDDLLAIRIASVNGTAAETAIKNGVLSIQLVNVAEWNYNPWDYEMQNGQITQYYGKGSNIIIPGTILDEPVTSIKERVFSYNHRASITIPSSVTSIGNNAFSNNQLTSVTIGANVTLSSSAIGSSFEELYNRNGKLAQTYMRRDNSRTWGFNTTEADFNFDPATGTITGYYGNSSRITIPETIGGIPVTAIRNGVFNLQKKRDGRQIKSGGIRQYIVYEMRIGKNVAFDNSAFTDSDFGVYYRRNKRKAGTYIHIYTYNDNNEYNGRMRGQYGRGDSWKWQYTPDR